MKFKEALIGIFVIAIIITFIIPISPVLLNLLIMVNIAISLLILLNAIYSKEPLEMSTFPTLLLITTLFRLAINLSSTRLMLGTGYAGEVIEVFGEFVAGGDLVVGTIVFVLLVLVNFMVITKGSGRIAEVTARFTLDAMPGKQMAIDADLNSGIIDENEARERRKKIQDESNFYGAMDGASKFVKGDAIAGIIITIINIVGGIVLGATGRATGTPLPIGEAAQLYTIMAIGDGLVSQIPAILISTATGVLVTKATSDKNLSDQTSEQLIGKSMVMYITGGVLIFLGVFSPLPMEFVIGGLIILIGAFMLDKQKQVQTMVNEITEEDVEAEEIRRPENVNSLLQVEPIQLLFGYGLLPLVDTNQGGDLLDRVVMIRRQIAMELGAVVPIIHLRDDIKLNPNQYKIMIKGVEIATGEILFDHYMAMNPGFVEDEIDGIETVEPYLGLPALWISESSRERAEALGYTVVDAPAIIATHVTEIIRTNLHEILTRQDTQSLINNVKEKQPVLVDELIPRQLSVGEVQKVLSNLLSEGVSIRDLVTILEVLADYSVNTKDTDLLTEYVRQGLKRAISSQYFELDKNNIVITLDPNLEQQIMDSVQKSEQGSYLLLDPSIAKKVYDNLEVQMTKILNMGVQPIILTSPMVRAYFKKLVEQVSPELVVLSYNEVDPKAEIQSIGMVSA
ncbi:MAG: flagellar biosynthesis protein FlhA [Lachnospirales bacterium]